MERISGSEVASEKAIAVIQARDNGGMEFGNSTGYTEKKRNWRDIYLEK